MQRLRYWVDVLFFCKHDNLSRVFTDQKSKAQYQVCLDCGASIVPKVRFDTVQYPKGQVA